DSRLLTLLLAVSGHSFVGSIGCHLLVLHCMPRENRFTFRRGLTSPRHMKSRPEVMHLKVAVLCFRRAYISKRLIFRKHCSMRTRRALASKQTQAMYCLMVDQVSLIHSEAGSLNR